MPFGTWWRGDTLPDLPSLPAFSACVSTDVPLIARLTNLSQKWVRDRLRAGNRAYVAFWDETPVAYGWVAEREGYIGDLHFSFRIPERNGYLWGFATLPEWRGRGIYPRLIQTIVRQEESFERFWIGYAPGNEASERGIKKAGFRVVVDFVIVDGHVAGLTLYEDSEYARASAC